MPTAADDIAFDMIAKWTAAFRTLDAAALSTLYSRHALFFGSNPELYRGRSGVAAYFVRLPRWSTSAVQFSDVVSEQVGPDLVNVAGIASFEVDRGAISLSLKITWVIVLEDGDWRIVSHHVSSKAPLI